MEAASFIQDVREQDFSVKKEDEVSGTRQIFECVRDKCMRTPRILEDLVFEVAESTGYKPGSVKDIIQRMEEDGILFQSGNKMEVLDYE